jgi:hypothetical protein
MRPNLSHQHPQHPRASSVAPFSPHLKDCPLYSRKLFCFSIFFCSAPDVICECFRSHRPGTSSTRGLLGVAPRLRGTISGGGKNVCIIAVRIHQHTLYLDQGHQGLGSKHESTWDTLSLVHRRLSTRSTLPATCYARTEDCRRSLRTQWSYTGPRQRCMGG